MTEPAPRLSRLSRRALVRVAGPDWRSFLQGLVSQDVETLADGEARYAALLTPQGRLLFELFLHGRPEGVALEVVAARREDLLQRLRMYRLRAKVDVEAEDGSVFVLWGGDAASEPGWTPDPRLASLGFRAVGAAPPAAEGAVQADAAEYDLYRRRLGVFDAAMDPSEDKAYPIELDLDLLRGIDFKKGCFAGQETTSRMKRRGGIRSRTIPLEVEGAPAPGTEVLAGDLRAGEVLSAVPGLALALVRLDRALGVELSVEGRPARLAPAPWLAGTLAEAAG